jgi:hypothetical protein
MIYVTREAKQELKSLLMTNDALKKSSLRIIDKGRGELNLVSDIAKPDDQVVEYEGKVLLVIEPGLASDDRNISLDAYTASDMHRVVISEEVMDRANTSVTVNWMSFP